jgi:hypothetical protein
MESMLEPGSAVGSNWQNSAISEQ